MTNRTPIEKNPAALGTVLGLLAAALFGLSATLATLLLGKLRPQLLAGLLYLGAGIGLSLLRVVRPNKLETALKRSDVMPLLGVVCFGGILGPLLMLLGLHRLGALTGSLLLNLESMHLHVLKYALASPCICCG